MWNLVSIPLNSSGVGNADLKIFKTRALVAVGVPSQPAITSGVTGLVITHVLPDAVFTALPLLTLATIATPYCETPSKPPVNPTGVPQSNNVFVFHASLNVRITNGVANQLATIALLLSDD